VIRPGDVVIVVVGSEDVVDVVLVVEEVELDDVVDVVDVVELEVELGWDLGRIQK
jgi:hypothetical protein